jgi:hypothetical protein
MGMVQGIWTSVNNLFLVWKPGYKAWDHRFWKFVGLNTHIQGPGLKWSLKLVNGEDIPGWEWSYGEVTSGGACEGHRKPLILLGNWSVIRHESCALIDNGKFTRLYWESHWPKKNHTILRFSNISNEYIYISTLCQHSGRKMSQTPHLENLASVVIWIRWTPRPPQRSGLEMISSLLSKWHLPSGNLLHSCWTWPIYSWFIVDLPIKDGDFL